MATETAPQSQALATTPYQQMVDRVTTQVIAAMPITVPDADLKRARARFRVAFSADAQQALVSCSPASVARAIVLSAMSGLYPGGPRPDVWLIPRAREVNWQMSFRGFIRLARRAGWELEPVLVFEGEKFEVHEGSSPTIVHIRNLELPKTWEALRYGYIRVFPVGRRAEARVAYLTKAEIEKRRAKAETDKVWREWPLEMTYKTLCSYAGNREMFPTDDPARYAMDASEQAEIGSGEAAGALPQGTATERLVQRLKAQPEPIEISTATTDGRPLDAVAADSVEAEVGSFAPEPGTDQPEELITAEDAEEILAFAAQHQLNLTGSGGLLEAIHPGDLAELPAFKANELWEAMRAAVKAKKGKA